MTNFGLIDLIYGVLIRSLNDLSVPHYVLVSQGMYIELIESFDHAYPEELDISMDCLAFANGCAFDSWGTLFTDGCCWLDDDLGLSNQRYPEKYSELRADSEY